jgi:hypothetical protein
VIAQGLISGTVDAAYLGYTFSKTVQRHGFRVLQDFANIEIPYQGIGIVARKSFLDQSPDVADRTLKALNRSIAYYQDPANKVSWRFWRSGCACSERGCGRIRAVRSSTAGAFSHRRRRATLCTRNVDPKFGKLKAENLIDGASSASWKDGVFK